MSDHKSSTEIPASGKPAVLCLQGQDLGIDDVRRVAAGHCQLSITGDATVLDRMQAAEALVRQAVDEGWRVYGVTTGFGSLAEIPVPPAEAAASQANLLSFLSTGAGRPIDRAHVLATMLLRANMLLRGVSGVRLEIVERLLVFLNAGAAPVVAELGSIGASGDLVPLATIARAITGQATACQVAIGDRVLDSHVALAELGLEPLELLPKEALAIVNGTSFSAGIAANCVHSAREYLALAMTTHGMMIQALLGHEEPFLPFVHECKPHPGQRWSATWMRQLLATKAVDSTHNQDAAEYTDDDLHLQDRYSLRCLPQYLGPIVEGMARVARVVETEMNSVTDNPLIDADNARFFQSGNFLGQYLGVAMDDLRRFLGLLAKHLDVQIAQLVTPEFSRGLPASLLGNRDVSFNMGLKGLQITGNSIMPLLTYLGNPIVEHFPTHAEQFNQNVNGLSWGAANLAARSVELYRHYASVALIFAAQAVDLRAYATHGHYDGRAVIGPLLVPLYEAIHETVDSRPTKSSPFVYNDRDQSLEHHLSRLAASIEASGAITTAVAPITASLCKFELGC